MGRDIKKVRQLMLVGAFIVFGGFLVHMSAGEFNPIPAATDHFARGQYYFNADNRRSGAYDLKRARGEYMLAISENPKGSVLVWYQLGRIDFIEGQFISATAKFKKQIEYFGDGVPNVYYMLGLAYAYQAQVSSTTLGWQQAENSFKKYLTLDPMSSWARVDLAWIYFSQGKFDEMLPVLEAGLAQNPDHAWLLNMYGLALFNTGNREGALSYFIKAQNAASILTVEDWGRAYPGNDPALWQEGLQSFKVAIAKNVALVQAR